jgi:hypothetical protein
LTLKKYRPLTFVTLAAITIGPDNLLVTVSKEEVKTAPNVELRGDEFSTADESTLYHHDQLNYTPPGTERGSSAAAVLEDLLQRREVVVDPVLDRGLCEWGHEGRNSAELDLAVELHDRLAVLNAEAVAVEKWGRPRSGADGELVWLLARDDLKPVGGTTGR